RRSCARPSVRSGNDDHLHAAGPVPHQRGRAGAGRSAGAHARPGVVIEAPAVRVGAPVVRDLRLVDPLIPEGVKPMKRRELLSGLAAAARATGCPSQAPSRVQTSPARFGSPVPLPSPATTDTISLEKAIGKRSMRAFRPDPLPTATIGQLLWAGQGITSPDGKRAAPSAGALYPLELYVVTPKQVMHYLPDGHRAETRAESDLRPGLKDAAVGQATVGAAPAVIGVAAVPSRFSDR